MSKDKYSVPVQKGPIKSDEPTMKTRTRAEQVEMDFQDRMGRRDGQILKTHTPKK